MSTKGNELPTIGFLFHSKNVSNFDAILMQKKSAISTYIFSRDFSIKNLKWCACMVCAPSIFDCILFFPPKVESLSFYIIIIFTVSVYRVATAGGGQTERLHNYGKGACGERSVGRGLL